MIKIGDVVPYRSKDGKVRFATVTGLETRGDYGRIWFRGRCARGDKTVFLPLYKTEQLIKQGHRYPLSQ